MEQKESENKNLSDEKEDADIIELEFPYIQEARVRPRNLRSVISIPKTNGFMVNHDKPDKINSILNEKEYSHMSRVMLDVI